MPQDRQPFRVARAVWWAIKNPPALIQGSQATALRPDESVARKPVSQHPVKIYQGSFRVIPPQRVQRIPQSIKRVGSWDAGPKSLNLSSGAGHPHAQTPVSFQVVRQPVLPLLAQDPRANDIIRHQVPITPHA